MDYNKAAGEFLVNLRNHGKPELMRRFNTYSHGEKLVLDYLYKKAGKPIVPSEIAKFTNTSTARIATILNNLEDKKMITREISRNDRRKILVAITDKGRSTAQAVQAQACSNLARVFEEMGEERTTSFIENAKLFLDIFMKQQEEKGETNV
ncbi:MarR family winged helix-turn-helix transcriptional regulator [Lactococcus kimchii]|uniref:MarR family winged helix-turn-helix transcriptional regulator n=1 Tax=Lactococcus sp. S-13 TaxID=2507158 RepID=UPI00102389D0|nr:MarR family transcriptional regulator [Lactococcus sp. S-13]RZI48410.1 MarR family transcriptional regulator [Lactococcus sp. S-13]